MSNSLVFSFHSTPFDVAYKPDSKTRYTTNFANLARTDDSEDNLRNVFDMMNGRLNYLLEEVDGHRYQITTNIITVNAWPNDDRSNVFPVSEFLDTTILDTYSNKEYPGAFGCNFSSYVRDYDFSILLPEYNRNQQTSSVPDDFGRLHGRLFQLQIESKAFVSEFNKNLLIVLSVSQATSYHCIDNCHPVLGVEYEHSEPSLTVHYFKEMGLRVRYFMPKGSCAPLAFFHRGDLENDYSLYELVSAISVMETFQKIYRPEIYNAGKVASKSFKPSLNNLDYAVPGIKYDRIERSVLGVEQGEYAKANFILPNRALLASIASRDND